MNKLDRINEFIDQLVDINDDLKNIQTFEIIDTQSIDRSETKYNAIKCHEKSIDYLSYTINDIFDAIEYLTRVKTNYETLKNYED